MSPPKSIRESACVSPSSDECAAFLTRFCEATKRQEEKAGSNAEANNGAG